MISTLRKRDAKTMKREELLDTEFSLWLPPPPNPPPSLVCLGLCRETQILLRPELRCWSDAWLRVGELSSPRVIISPVSCWAADSHITIGFPLLLFTSFPPHNKKKKKEKKVVSSHLCFNLNPNLAALRTLLQLRSVSKSALIPSIWRRLDSIRLNAAEYNSGGLVLRPLN